MILLPLTHEHATARRLPWVTIAIIATNLVVHALTAQSGERALTQLQEKLGEAVELLVEQPDLELRAPLSELITPEARERLREENARGGRPEGVPLRGLPMLRTLEDLTQDPGGAPGPGVAGDEPEDERRSRAQRALDVLAGEIGQLRARIPALAYGYIPAHGELSTLLTYQFLHGGYLHLLGNLWFLWLVGCNVEDVWGRRVFSGFYLVGGIAAALLHHFFAGDSAAPLIGASGAVAAAMGAFLVQRSATKIRFLLLFFIRPWFFSAPAWLVLPLYLVLELAQALGSSSGPVAHWAHVGGMLFGIGFAVVLRRSGMEQRLSEAIEAETTVTEDPRLAQAAQLMSTRRPAEAIPLLEALADEDPWNVEARLSLIRAANITGEIARADRARIELIQIQLSEGGSEAAAIELFDELVAAGRAGAIAEELRLRLGRALDRAGQTERALGVFADLYAGARPGPIGVRALVEHAEISLRERRWAEARALLEHGLAHRVEAPALEGVLTAALARAEAGAEAARRAEGTR